MFGSKVLKPFSQNASMTFHILTRCTGMKKHARMVRNFLPFSMVSLWAAGTLTYLFQMILTRYTGKKNGTQNGKKKVKGASSKINLWSIG